MALLEARNVVAGYGDAEILHGVDLDVGDQEIVTIVGPNGAGKSTLMKAIYGLIDCWEGTVTLGGEDITSLRADQVTERGMCYVPQRANVFPTLTVKENLEMGAYTKEAVTSADFERVWERFPILEERQTQKAGTMSGGQQQMLAIGRALVGDPDLLLVDEPSEGVQPSIVQSITEDLKQINEEFGTTILFVEQNLSVIQGLAERCYAIDHGTIVDEITGDAVSERDQLEEYLVV